MKLSYTREDVALIAVSAVMAVGSFYVSIFWGGVFFTACSIIALFAPYLRRFQNRYPSQKVVFDDEALTATRHDGHVESIRWSDLAEIEVVTTDEGPYVDDVFWLFSNEDRSKGCVVVNDAEGFRLLLKRLQRLQGFDNGQVITAMTCATNRRFLVWRRAGSTRGARAKGPTAGGSAA